MQVKPVPALPLMPSRHEMKKLQHLLSNNSSSINNHNLNSSDQ